jgi:hypothetical protein
MKSQKLTPGTPSPISGEVRPLYPNGKLGPEVTIVRGKRLPPSATPGTTYVVSRPARNRSGYPKK